MKVYNYHPETKEYIGESEARPNPLEPGNFLIPALATTTILPGAIPGKARVFDGAWTQVEDHRGATIWNTVTLESKKVADLGAIPVEWTKLPMPDNESKWDGSAWVPDQDIIDARLTEEARIAAKAKAITDNLPSWAIIEAAINAADTIPKLRAIMLKLARVLYWDVKNKEK